MQKISTDAWVLVSKNNRNESYFHKKQITFDDVGDTEVIAEPIYGCLEGNYIHAIKLKPENIFHRRNEDEIILGNSGVLKILKTGNKVKRVQPGDLCILFGNGIQDEAGYTIKATGYDKPNSIGVFAKTTKLNENEIIKIPADTRATLMEWAAFSLKYITAWSNWNVAYQCWKIQMPEIKPEDTYVFGWGGGVTFGELVLAKHMGCKCYMLTSKEDRIVQAEEYGIKGVNRTKYTETELLEFINHETKGRGVSIFIDYIGLPVYKITMKALGRQGVITTAGWKEGSMLPILRANECQQRHIHVFTHYARYQEGIEAAIYAEENHWFPPISQDVYDWEDLPDVLQDYADNKITSWFPIIKISD